MLKEQLEELPESSIATSEITVSELTNAPTEGDWVMVGVKSQLSDVFNKLLYLYYFL